MARDQTTVDQKDQIQRLWVDGTLYREIADVVGVGKSRMTLVGLVPRSPYSSSSTTSRENGSDQIQAKMQLKCSLDKEDGNDRLI